MKSLFTYLILFILFAAGVKLVSVQQKYTRPIQEQPEKEPTASTQFFLSRFATNKPVPEISSAKRDAPSLENEKKRPFWYRLKNWSRT